MFEMASMHLCVCVTINEEHDNADVVEVLDVFCMTCTCVGIGVCNMPRSSSPPLVILMGQALPPAQPIRTHRTHDDDDDNQLLNHQQIIDMSLLLITLSGWSLRVLGHCSGFIHQPQLLLQSCDHRSWCSLQS